MKRFLTKDNIITFLIGVVAALLLVGVSFMVYEKNFASTDNKKSESDLIQTPTENTPTTDETGGNSTEQNETKPQPVVTPNPTPTPTPEVTQPVITPTPILPGVESATEEDVISFFTVNEASLEANKNNVGFKDTAKEYFITIVDFIFYDGEIKGYKFKDLTATAKLKVIKLALSIDSKIDSYFPAYKETIKAGYQSVKAKLLKTYLETMNKLCDTVGEDSCNQAKSDFQDMKASFGFTFDLLLQAGGDLKTAIAEWYKNFKAE